jgi:hypothetical protein
VKPQWEYWVEELGGGFRGARSGELEELLNEASAEDWELAEIAALANSNRLLVVMRRRLDGSSRKRQRQWP